PDQAQERRRAAPGWAKPLKALSAARRSATGRLPGGRSRSEATGREASSPSRQGTPNQRPHLTWPAGRLSRTCRRLARELCRSASEGEQEMRPERLWWCLPAIVLCAADGLLTLWGQPEEYWSGNYASIREGHPVAAWFLSLHPLAFAASGVPYLVLVVA